MSFDGIAVLVQDPRDFENPWDLNNHLAAELVPCVFINTVCARCTGQDRRLNDSTAPDYGVDVVFSYIIRANGQNACKMLTRNDRRLATDVASLTACHELAKLNSETYTQLLMGQKEQKSMRLNIRLKLLFATLAVIIFLTGSTFSLQAENWPSWRGPTSNGISTDKNLPTEWDGKTKKNVAWRLPLPGPAGSTPVVWGDRIFLTSVDGEDLVLIGVSTAGKEQWRKTIGKGNKIVRNDEGNSASPSPVTDGKHVWAMMANGGLGCYTVQGKEVWKFDLQDRVGKFKIAFGMTSSPVLHDGRLFLQLIHGDGKADTQEAVVVALNAATGEEIWKQERITGAYAENEHSYASPILYNDGKIKYLITHGADYTIAHDLADGNEIWRLGLNPQDDSKLEYHRTLRFVASPAAAEGIIVVPTAKRRPTFVIRPDGRGDITNSKSANIWTQPKTPDVPSPLIHDGLVYLCMQNGNLHCLNAKTGKEYYAKRTHVDRHRASPFYANGKIYTTARDGVVTVTKTGKEFKILAENKLGETVTASPAISNGTIYFRSWDALWAIRQK